MSVVWIWMPMEELTTVVQNLMVPFNSEVVQMLILLWVSMIVWGSREFLQVNQMKCCET